MLKKSVLSKFEWSGQPKELPDLFIENLLLHSSSYNFAVTNFKTRTPDKDADGEFWSYFSILEREPKYKRAKRIQVTNGLGEAYQTKDFVLFNDFKHTPEHNYNYIKYYSQMISSVNRAIEQHVIASQLVATIYASNNAEAAEVERLFKNYKGVKIVKSKKDITYNGRPNDFVQFEIEPRLKELHDLKKELERDAFLRLAIDFGTDKTHITNLNIEDSEQAIDLMNSYELKLRQDFCNRYNAWKGKDVLSVKIHTISKHNTVEKSEGDYNNDNDDDRT